MHKNGTAYSDFYLPFFGISGRTGRGEITAALLAFARHADIRPPDARRTYRDSKGMPPAWRQLDVNRRPLGPAIALGIVAAGKKAPSRRLGDRVCAVLSGAWKPAAQVGGSSA